LIHTRCGWANITIRPRAIQAVMGRLHEPEVLLRLDSACD